MKPVLAVIVATAIAFGPNARPAAARPAEGSVTSLSIVPASGKAEVVIGVDGGLEVRDFTLRSPDRIVLDLSGASLGKLGARGYDRIARGGITDVRYSNFRKGTVRVVLYLDAPHTYQISKADGEVRVTVAVPIGAKFAAWHAGAGAMPEAQVATADAEARAEPRNESRTVTLADTRSPVVEPAGEPAPAATDRVIARLVADNADARTTRTARESEVHPGRVSAESRTQPAPPQQRSQQPRITVTYQGSDIRDVLAAFAAFSGRTIIPSQNVGSLKVDAEIRDQPWDVALQAILASQGLAASEDANGIIIVDTQDRIAARSATEPLTTRLVRLNYQRATSVADQIRQRILLCIPSSDRSGGSSSQAAGQPPVAGAPPAQQSAPVTPGTGAASSNGPCVGRGSVSADENTNTVSITAPVSSIAELVGFAGSLDLRQPQVSIKAKIVLVNRTDLDALGIKYDLGSANQFFSTIVQRSDSLGNPGNSNDAPTVLLGGNTVSAIANASGNVPGAALRLIYSTALGNFDFSTFLDALQEVNLLDVQAEPSVTIINNKTASLTSGVQVPFVPLVSSGGSGTSLTGPVTVERVQTGVTLLVTPSVTNNRQIQMHVEVTNSDVSFTNNGTLIDNNNTKNDVLVPDGQTIVIGGLTQTSVRVTKSGIPLLVDLPLIGRLFGYTTRQEQRRDLLILITPHIVDEGQMSSEGSRP